MKLLLVLAAILLTACGLRPVDFPTLSVQGQEPAAVDLVFMR